MSKSFTKSEGFRIAFSYHLVTSSPWPLTVSISLLSMILGFIMKLNNKLYDTEIIILSLVSLLYGVYYWIKDIIIEGKYLGDHTQEVQRNLTLGFNMFIVSEVLLFSTFFLGYFYNSLIPDVNLGYNWPPVGIITLDAKMIPLLNTIILFTSGISVTASHNYIIIKDYNKYRFYLFLTIVLGFIFLTVQYYEYFNSFFTIADSVYGSSFYLLTGFHMLHVCVGAILLLITWIRFLMGHFTNKHHLNVTFANVYWHFVDIVWIFLFIVVYCWGS